MTRPSASGKGLPRYVGSTEVPWRGEGEETEPSISRLHIARLGALSLVAPPPIRTTDHEQNHRTASWSTA